MYRNRINLLHAAIRNSYYDSTCWWAVVSRPDISMGNFTLFLTMDISLHPDLYDTNMIRSTPLSKHGDDPGRTFSPQYRRTWKKEPTRIRGSIRQVSLLASIATDMMAIWKDTLHLMKPRWGEKPRLRLAKPILWRSDNRCYTFVLRRRQVNQQLNVLSMKMNWKNVNVYGNYIEPT